MNVYILVKIRYLFNLFVESEVNSVCEDTYYVYNRPLKWYSKYNKNIRAQLDSFNAIEEALDELTNFYNISVDRQLDVFVYVFTIVFQNYMYYTSFKCVDRNIICSFFSNKNVMDSLDRLKYTYKNIVPLSFLVRKSGILC